MPKKKQTNKLCKIVYFDEDSVTDYVQIVAGGKLEKTTELLNESSNSGNAETGAKTSVGFGGLLKALIGFEASASLGASLETSFNATGVVKNIVKNTMLTDFIAIFEDDCPDNAKACTSKSAMRKFKGYSVTAPKESLSFVALISPYLSMVKGGSGLPAGEFNIAIEKIDNAIKSAKGYYDFVGTKNGESVIFRFNIIAFKNNYKVTDLLKMDITIYAIKVGTSSLSKLDISSELDVDSMYTTKDNPTYSIESKAEVAPNADKLLEVYDVFLAGVEAGD
jgi:hypothetical protein